jgi:hypothetical protein
MRYRALLLSAAASGLLMAPLALSSARAQDTTPPPTPQTPQTPAPPANPQTPPEEPDEDNSRKRFRIGPELGVFIPTSGKTRDAFGDAWYNYGVGLGSVVRANQHGTIAFNLSFFSYRSGNGRVFMAPVGIGYRVALSDNKQTTPYAGISANLVFTDLKSDKYNVGSGIRTTAGGTVFVGTTLGDRAYIQARYLATGRVSGFDLSGTNFSAGYRF